MEIDPFSYTNIVSIFKFHTKLPPLAQSSPGPDRSRHRRTGPRHRRIASAPAPLSTSPPQQQTRKGPGSRGSWPLFLLQFGRQKDCDLGFVDACLNNDFRVQITPDRRRATQLRKENPIRLWCSPRPPRTKRCSSRDFADQLVLSVSTCKRETSLIGLHAFRSC